MILHGIIPEHFSYKADVKSFKEKDTIKSLGNRMHQRKYLTAILEAGSQWSRAFIYRQETISHLHSQIQLHGSIA